MRLTGILLIAAMTAAGCRGEKRPETADKTSGETAPLVLLCRDIDYSDTARLHSEEYMAKTMGKIVRLMSKTDSAATREALGLLIAGLKRDEKSIRLADSLMNLFFNNPASPARDETLYIRYLNTLLSHDSIPEGMRAKGDERLRRAMMNRQGKVAADFRYVDREGTEGSLHRFEASRILLVFYDPECSHCSDILADLAANQGINQAINEGKLSVLAIYAEGKRDVWDKTKRDMARNWTVGYDLTGILDNDLYDLPAMPLLYLLDNDHRVLLKDPDPSEILNSKF